MELYSAPRLYLRHTFKKHPYGDYNLKCGIRSAKTGRREKERAEREGERRKKTKDRI